MAEVTSQQAANILSVSIMTIHRRVDDGHLKARRQGIKGELRIDVEELRRFAEQFGYRFDESLSQRVAK